MQTEVKLTTDIAIAGMPARDRRTVDLFSAINLGPDDEVSSGDFVHVTEYSRNDGVGVRKIGTSGVTEIAGIVWYDSKEQGITRQNGTISVVRKGLVYVKASWFSGAVAAGSFLAYDISAGKFVANGNPFLKGSLGTGDIVVGGGLKTWTAVSAAEATAGTKLIQVEVNLPCGQFVAS